MPIIQFTIPVQIRSYLNTIDPHKSNSLAGISTEEREELIIEHNKKYKLDEQQLELIKEVFPNYLNRENIYKINNYNIEIDDLEKQILKITIDYETIDYYTSDPNIILLKLVPFCYYRVDEGQDSFDRNRCYIYDKGNYFYYTENYKILEVPDIPTLVIYPNSENKTKASYNSYHELVHFTF